MSGTFCGRLKERAFWIGATVVVIVGTRDPNLLCRRPTGLEEWWSSKSDGLIVHGVSLRPIQYVRLSVERWTSTRVDLGRVPSVR